MERKKWADDFAPSTEPLDVGKVTGRMQITSYYRVSFEGGISALEYMSLITFASLKGIIF